MNIHRIDPAFARLTLCGVRVDRLRFRNFTYSGLPTCPKCLAKTEPPAPPVRCHP